MRVEGGADGDHWEIRVIDCGPGIDAALRTRLFGRFERGAAPAPADAGGSGLGLAFVRVVATRHRGSVGVRDAGGDAGQGGGRGTGSEFFLRLPRHDEPPG